MLVQRRDQKHKHKKKESKNRYIFLGLVLILVSLGCMCKSGNPSASTSTRLLCFRRTGVHIGFLCFKCLRIFLFLCLRRTCKSNLNGTPERLCIKFQHILDTHLCDKEMQKAKLEIVEMAKFEERNVGTRQVSHDLRSSTQFP